MPQQRAGAGGGGGGAAEGGVARGGGGARARARAAVAMAAAAAAVALVLAGAGAPAAAHGFLKEPRSRNYVAAVGGLWSSDSWRVSHEEGSATPARESCPHCLNRQASGMICGETQPGVPYAEYTNPKDMYGNAIQKPSLQADWKEGDVVPIEFVTTTHHYGHIEVYACCEDKLTEECFEKNPLTFVEDELYGAPPHPEYPVRGYVAPLHYHTGAFTGNMYRQGGGDNLGGMPFRHLYRVPEGVSGDRCTMLWKYVTSHNCETHGYDTYPWPSQSWRQPGADHFRCPNPPDKSGNGYPERFWNCADVAIRPRAFRVPGKTPTVNKVLDRFGVAHEELAEPEEQTISREAETVAAIGGEPAGIHEMCGGKSSDCGEDKACLGCRDEGFFCERDNEYHWQCNRDEASKLKLAGRR